MIRETYGQQREDACPSCGCAVITTRRAVEPCRACKCYRKIERYMRIARAGKFGRGASSIERTEHYHDLAQTQAVLAAELRAATQRCVDKFRAKRARLRGAA